MTEKPKNKPLRLNFSSGPCSKRLGWQLKDLNGALLGRSHRSKEGKEKLQQAINKTISLLEIPQDYKVAIVPASGTGAIEMAMWNLLGSRPVEVLSWEVFGKAWKKDIQEQLKIKASVFHDADFGLLPNLEKVNFENDVIFTWNGTTSGVRVPNGDWIPEKRNGLTICDATSAIFAQDLDWNKLDATTFSWQKVLGGEAAHGMLILSPRALGRLENHVPSWPVPKIFRLTKSQKIIEGVFRGETLNTPSMLCLEDYLDALNWAEDLGGFRGLMKKVNNNAAVINDWVNRTSWIDFLCENPDFRSNTSVCLKFLEVKNKEEDSLRNLAKDIGSLLAKEEVAYDIVSHREAPPGLRIWTGATIEYEDIELLMPWLDWAYLTCLENNKY
ncbi:MAG: phosphoserine transaminase [Rhodobiaceae bacterium]|nr:phosphoserine transaminase [Rhodobiaceae bacterium]